jgi:hypothetical protein
LEFGKLWAADAIEECGDARVGYAARGGGQIIDVVPA